MQSRMTRYNKSFWMMAFRTNNEHDVTQHLRALHLAEKNYIHHIQVKTGQNWRIHPQIRKAQTEQ